jgi:hypothetical protein
MVLPAFLAPLSTSCTALSCPNAGSIATAINAAIHFMNFISPGPPDQSFSTDSNQALFTDVSAKKSTCSDRLVADATRALVNSGQQRERGAEEIERRNQAVGKRQPRRANRLVAAWAHHDSFVAMHHAPASTESPEKFHVLHQWNLWKTADLGKNAAPAKYSVITAPHSEQDACVMRKAVGQAINRGARREADSEKTACHTRIDHDAFDFIKTSPRHFRIRMEKPEKIAARHTGACVHL